MPEAVRRDGIVVPEAAWLQPAPALTRFILRGDAAARAAAGAVFGVALPEQACRAISDGGRSALWLGPDERLLLAPDGAVGALAAACASALTGQAHSLVDVSHRQVGFVVQGPHAEWLLESQCPLPLNLRDFPVGMCTRTLFAKAEIVLWRVGEQSFHVEVWRSFATYLLGLLQEVARELPLT
jgi:sarcosine oxidase subunit gamma